MSVIEHIEPDPGADVLALRRMAEVVRPRGCVVISVPIAPATRSEYLASEVYGRKPTSEGLAFFSARLQCRLPAQALRGGGAELDARGVRTSEWPDHPLLHLQPRFLTAIGFVGASFPLLANRFVVTTPSSTIPEMIDTQGDAILVFTRS
jgi:hypothetical protein